MASKTNIEHVTAELQSMTNCWIEGSIKYTELRQFCQNNNIDINDRRILKVIYGPHLCSDDDLEVLTNQNENFLDDESNLVKSDNIINHIDITCFSQSEEFPRIEQICNELKLNNNQKYPQNFELAKRQELFCLLLQAYAYELSSVENSYILNSNTERILKRISSPNLISSQLVCQEIMELIELTICYSILDRQMSKEMFNTILDGLSDVKKFLSLEIWELLLDFVFEMTQTLDDELLTFEYFDMLRRFPPKRVEFALLILLEKKRDKNAIFLLPKLNKFKCRIIHSISHNGVMINLETAKQAMNYLVSLLNMYNDKQKVQLVIETFGGLFGSLIEKYQHYLNQLLLKITQQLSNEYANKCSKTSDFQKHVNQERHTNWCCLLLHLLDHKNFEWNNNLIHLLCDYALSLAYPAISTPKESPETMSWALLLLENIFITQKYNHKNLILFKNKLSVLVEHCATVAVNSKSNIAKNSTRNKVHWFSQWFLDNIFKLGQRSQLEQNLPSQASIYCGNLDFRKRRHFYDTYSMFCVTWKEHFYQVIYQDTLIYQSDQRLQTGCFINLNNKHVTGGFILFKIKKLRWRPLLSILTHLSKAENYVNSIGIDGIRRHNWLDLLTNFQKNISRRKASDVIGCNINKKENTFDFPYINSSIRLPHINFLPYPYQVSVCLSSGQQCLYSFCEVTSKQSNMDFRELLKRLPIQINGPIANAMFNYGLTNNISEIKMIGSPEQNLIHSNKLTNDTDSNSSNC